MKIFGIVLLVMGGLNFIVGLIALGANTDQHITSFRAGIFLIAIGAYLLYRAKKKIEEDKDRNDWNNL